MATASRPVARLAWVAVGGSAVALLVAGCGGGSSSTNGSTARTSGSNANRSISFDSVSGKVIAATATSASVQQTSGPTSIDFSSSTRFTSMATTTRSSLAKGDCVMVIGTGSAAASSGGGSTAAAAAAPKNITGRSVTVTSTSGCQQGNGFPGAGGSTGAPPAGGFNGLPSEGGLNGTPPAFNPGAGGPGALRGRLGGGAFGEITAISGSSFTVGSTFRGSNAKTTVKTTSSTTYEATSAATASDLTHGVCVSAVGSNDVSGVLQARIVSISSPVKGECRTAPVSFDGGRRFGGGGFAGPGGQGGAPGA